MALKFRGQPHPELKCPLHAGEGIHFFFTTLSGLGLLQVCGLMRVPQPAMGMTIFRDSFVMLWYPFMVDFFFVLYRLQIPRVIFKRPTNYMSG